MEGENGGQYEVADWSVEENVGLKQKQPKVAPDLVPQPVLPGISRLLRAYWLMNGERGPRADSESFGLVADALDELDQRWPKLSEKVKAQVDLEYPSVE